MASAYYAKVVNLVSSYVGAEKGPGIVERQLKYCTASADAFGAADLTKIVNYVAAASALYLPDKAKAAEMKERIKAMAG